MRDDCIFCLRARGEKGGFIWENDIAAAFNDVHPKAPVHILVVPKQHIESLDHADAEVLGKLMQSVQDVAKSADVHGRYKVQINVGRAGGQVVDHLHIHILGGKDFTE